MGTLGEKLVVALVAALAGSIAGLSGSASDAKRPIVQTIAPSQPSRMKLAVFHPSANPRPTPAAAEEPRVKAQPEITPRSDAAPLVRTAPVTRDPLAVSSGLTVSSGLGDEPTVAKPWRSSDLSASSQKPGERSRKRQSARFGQSEIVDPWSTKR